MPGGLSARAPDIGVSGFEASTGNSRRLDHNHVVSDVALGSCTRPSKLSPKPQLIQTQTESRSKAMVSHPLNPKPQTFGPKLASVMEELSTRQMEDRSLNLNLDS